MNKVMLKKGALLLLGGCVWFSGLLGESVYTVDTGNSNLRWTGRKVTGSHYGTVKLASGRLVLDESGNIVRGEFDIDLETISVEDIKDPEDNLKLTNHLKDDDFFGVQNHRFAKFVIRNATKENDDSYTLTGDLTIKGITHPITFTAKISEIDGAIKGLADVRVDRTLWGIRYGSGKFFENLGNRLIYDEFDVKVELVARKLDEESKSQSS